MDGHQDGGQTLRDGVIKVAQQHDLSDEDIRLLTSRVNRTAIVPMHQKIASAQLGIGATFDTVDPDDVCAAARKGALAPKVAMPTLPPKRASHTSGRTLFDRTYPVAHKEPDRPMEDYEADPVLIEVEVNLKKLAQVRDHFMKSARDLREEAMGAKRDAARAHEVLHNEIETHLRAGTPVEILKQAASASAFHQKYIADLQQQLGTKEMKIANDAVVELELEHPIVKEAQSFHKCVHRAKVAEHHASRMEAIGKSAAHRLFFMERGVVQ